jgi:outer membrane immunogenic protein
MKKYALQVAALSLALAGTASAADLRRPLPVKAPAPVAIAAYSWTGCYVGAGGGYGMWNQDNQYSVTGVGPVGAEVQTGGRGWFGTVQVGCDYQIAPSIVIGAFGDYDFGSIKGDMAHGLIGGVVGDEKLKSSWAAGGRIGWVPWTSQQFMVFVSGGYTQARFSDVNFRTIGGNAPTAFSVGKNTYDGWFIGSGYEYGLGFLPGLFWKTEYRFAQYGDETLQILLAGAPFVGNFVNSEKYVHTVRSEIVWRFNFGGPVVARY